MILPTFQVVYANPGFGDSVTISTRQRLVNVFVTKTVEAKKQPQLSSCFFVPFWRRLSSAFIAQLLLKLDNAQTKTNLHQSYSFKSKE